MLQNNAKLYRKIHAKRISSNFSKASFLLFPYTHSLSLLPSLQHILLSLSHSFLLSFSLSLTPVFSHSKYVTTCTHQHEPILAHLHKRFNHGQFHQKEVVIMIIIASTTPQKARSFHTETKRRLGNETAQLIVDWAVPPPPCLNFSTTLTIWSNATQKFTDMGQVQSWRAT